MLMALRVMRGFAPVWAATNVAAKTAVFHTGERRHVSTACPPAPSCGSAAQRLRSARHDFRDILMALVRLCRYSLPLAFCAENAALALRTLSMPHDHAARGDAPGSLALALPKVNFNSTLK